MHRTEKLSADCRSITVGKVGISNSCGAATIANAKLTKCISIRNLVINLPRKKPYCSFEQIASGLPWREKLWSGLLIKYCVSPAQVADSISFLTLTLIITESVCLFPVSKLPGLGRLPLGFPLGFQLVLHSPMQVHSDFVTNAFCKSSLDNALSVHPRPIFHRTAIFSAYSAVILCLTIKRPRM